MAYDSGIVSFTTKTNKVDLVDAAHINAVQTELVTIETILGTGVKGDRADLKTRLNNALDADGSILSGSSFPSPALASQLFYRTDLGLLYLYSGSAWGTIGGADPVTAGDNYIGGKISGGTVSSAAGKVDEIVSRYVGTLRIKIGVGSTAGATFQIYKNGSAVGTARSSNGWFSEDISGIVNGDLIQLYCTAYTSQTRWSGLEIYCSEKYIPKGYLVYSGDDVNYPSEMGVVGNRGDLMTRADGGASTSIYVKTAATTWTAK